MFTQQTPIIYSTDFPDGSHLPTLYTCQASPKQISQVANIMAVFIILLYILGLALTTSCGNRPLNEFIKYFEPLNYRPKPRVAKRWTHADAHPDSQSLVIKAFGRKMYLNLHRDSISLATDVQVVDGYNRRIGFGRHSFVVGRLKGEDGSIVNGVLASSGVFTGRIATRDDTYFIEPAQRYFGSAVKFHSVIYRDRDVHYNVNITLPRRITRDMRQRVQNMQSRTRNRRSINYHSNICRMSLEADHTFLKMAGGHVYAIQMTVNHIQALNAIFCYTFNTTDTYAPHGIQFQIARIKVYVNETDTVLARGNQFDAATFLTFIDENDDYSEYCQALFFTSRYFLGGVTGLAHTGGACTESNTAVVTFRRGNMRLPFKVTELAVAHAMGHAFGAEHDPSTNKCQPNGKDGNYIMKSAGTNGDHHNNAIFSPCSVRQMKQFIANSGGKKKCLVSLQSTEDRGGLCGNGVVDTGENINPNYHEECDCGDGKTCQDAEPGNCCNFKTCKLNKHAVCSFSNGFCCNATTCTYKQAGDVCMPELECSQVATCPGNTSSCPDPTPKKNFLECNRNSSLCMNGSCSLSVCVKFGLEACFCKKKEDQCKICCLYEGKCQAAKYITKMKSEIKSIYLSSGSLCLDNKGFCDVFHDCHIIDTRGFYNHYFTKEGKPRTL